MLSYIIQIMATKKNIILVFGGSFDPPHKTHISMLEEAVRLINPGKVILALTWLSPFKKEHFADFNQRKKLLSIALKRTHFANICHISDFEFKRRKKTYTWQLIKRLKSQFPSSEIFFLMGSDSFISLDRWKKSQYIRKSCKLIVAIRKGFVPQKGGAIFLSKIYPSDSSTEFRERALFCDFSLLHDEVAEEIMKQGIYFSDLACAMKKTMSKKRFSHIANTALLSMRLAKSHGIDIRKAVTSALLHDCAKELPFEKQVSLSLKLFPVSLVKKISDMAPLALHQFSSAAMAKSKFGICDRQILKAIAWHSTGENKPSKLGKLLFVCDFASYDRRHNSADKVRKIAFSSIDKAYVEVLKLKEKYIIEKGGKIAKI